ncbi:hypothetical protein LXL04_011901 [Taraxacum kok-saghyz]
MRTIWTILEEKPTYRLRVSPKIRNLLCPPPKKKPLAVAVPLKLASSNPSIDSRSPITRRLLQSRSQLQNARRATPPHPSQTHAFTENRRFHSRFHRATAKMDHIDAINMSGDEGDDEIGTKPTAAVQRKNLTRSGLSTESSDKHMEIAPSPSDSRKYMETMVKGHTNSQVLQVYDMSESELANDWKS